MYLNTYYIVLRRSIYFLLCICCSAIHVHIIYATEVSRDIRESEDVIRYQWDTHMGITGTPYGTGYSVWRSPDEVNIDGITYTFTNRVHAQGSGVLLNMTIPIDFGIVEAYEQTSPTGMPPFIIYQGCTNGVYQVDVPTIGSLNVYYQMCGKAYIDTDRHLYYEFTNFNIHTLSFGDINSVVTLDGATNEGNGTYVSVLVPEPSLLLLALVFLLKSSVTWRNNHT